MWRPVLGVGSGDLGFFKVPVGEPLLSILLKDGLRLSVEPKHPDVQDVRRRARNAVALTPGLVLPDVSCAVHAVRLGPLRVRRHHLPGIGADFEPAMRPFDGNRVHLCLQVNGGMPIGGVPPGGWWCYVSTLLPLGVALPRTKAQ